MSLDLNKMFRKTNDISNKHTAWDPMAVYAVDLEIAEIGIEADCGVREPFGGLQVWSMNKVLISGLGLGFLQSWCCQFKLPWPKMINVQQILWQKKQSSIEFAYGNTKMEQSGNKKLHKN